MDNLLKFGKRAAPVAAGLCAFALLAAIFRAFLNHEMGSLALLVTAQIALLGLIFVPQVLADVRDRQTLSVYREMYIGR